MGTGKKLPAARAGKAPAGLFGPPPLVAGEDPSQYEERLSRVYAAVRPKDILEEMVVRDVVDLDWEIGRLRRVKAGVFAAGLQASLFAKLIAAPKMTETKARELAQRFVAEDPSAGKEVDKALSSVGLTMAAVTAHTMMVRLRDVEAIERLIASVEGRRHAALRELERRRSALAEASRREEEVVDADFEDVGPDESVEPNQADERSEDHDDGSEEENDRFDDDYDDDER
jgi:hypothetical protein